MLPQKLLSGGTEETLYSDDVFSAFTYTGNGSTQTITNGIDLAGKGGLVWLKQRSDPGYGTQHTLVDTTRGVGNTLVSNTTAATVSDAASLSAFNANGFSLGNSGNVNSNSATFGSCTFRKAPKFFDVVTWTGNNAASRQIPHSLGQEVGMIAMKQTNSTSNWNVYHRSLGTGAYVNLNQTNASSIIAGAFGTVDSTYFGVGSALGNNGTGTEWVAYLFAHDASTDGIIQCGVINHTQSTTSVVNLGWEPQFILEKRVDSSTDGGWYLYDSMRGMTTRDTNDNYLQANTSSAESSLNGVAPTATGFEFQSGQFTGTYIYLAIRRPNKPPTTGTQVYNAAISQVGKVPAYDAGWPVDLAWRKDKTGSNSFAWSRLTGGTNYLKQDLTSAETSWGSDVGKFDSMTSWFNQNENNTNFVSWMFRRAPKFMDVVCYKAPQTNVSHNLGVAPELCIIKRRDNSTFGDWAVSPIGLSSSDLYLNRTDAYTSASFVTAATPTTFTVGGNEYVGGSGTSTYVAYLFATLAGISYCGSVTKVSGTSLNVDCGFTTGSRFILLKRTDASGDWYIWDSVRGIISANDPYLLLNSTAAEVTGTDYIDPYSAGFTIVDGGLANGTYIVLSIA